MKSGMCFPLKSLVVALCFLAYIMPRAQSEDANTVNTVMLGAFMGEVKGHARDKQNTENNLEALEVAIGHPVAFQLSYYAPDSLTAANLHSDPMVQGDLKHHRVPYLSYSCKTNLDNYIDGNQDAVLDQTAAALKSLTVSGKPVLVLFRPFHEFNLCLNNAKQCANGDDPDCFTPGYTVAQEQAQFIAYWKHLYNRIVVRDGARNVMFVWCPSAGGGNPLSLEELEGFMPPRRYLAYIGFDVYDEGATKGLLAVLTPPYNAFASHGLGMIWTETGEDSSDCVHSEWTQARYFSDLENNIQNFPLLKGFGYFGSWPQFPDCKADWILDDEGTAAFIRLAQNPNFEGPTY
jgi:hypothetical protein